jgi:predicted RNA-binding protein with PUA-like domain
VTRNRSKDDYTRPRYWAFQANPNIYNIEAAVRHLEVDTWPTRERDIRMGDKVIIWKALGNSHRRGVVALGEVISDPELGPAANSQFLVNSSSGQTPEPRVQVRYICPPLLPLWIGDAMEPVLERLSVSRARGTVFKVTEEQWEEVVEAAGGWPTTADE